MPFLTIIGSNGVPLRMDWPAMVCCHATGMPSGPSPMRARWT